MAASPDYKVYSVDNEYIGCTKHPFHAAMLIAGMGEGTIRYGHDKKNILWNEGHETIPASESYDTVSEICLARVNKIQDCFKEQQTNTQRVVLNVPVNWHRRANKSK